MAGNAGAAAQIANVVIQDYLDRGPDSAYCQYLELVDDGPGGWHPAIGFARNRFCNPTPPPPPPSTDFFNAGGVPCRLYQVTYGTGSPGGPLTPTVVNRRGPIGLISKTFTSSSGNPGIRWYLTSGDNVGCTRTVENIAGSDNINVTDVLANIISIVPLEGTPETEIPVWQPPLQPPPRPFPPFNIEVDVNVDGIEVNVPLRFGPVIETDFGPTIQIGFNPTANFNPAIDIDLGLNPTFGLDVDLDFVVPLGGNPNQPTPPTNQPPIQLPPVSPPGSGNCEEFDYERIEDFIIQNRCCNPITNVQNVGSFTFETLNQVAEFDVPDNAVAVFIAIVPSNNARVYKFAGADSEYGHGNATLTSRGNALSFERLYVNNHVLFYPESADSKGIRISCGKGTIVTVNAGVYVPVEEV